MCTDTRKGTRNRLATGRCIALLGLQFLPECSWGQDSYRLYCFDALQFGIAGHQYMDLARNCCSDDLDVIFVFDPNAWQVFGLNHDRILRDEFKVFGYHLLRNGELVSEDSSNFVKHL